MRPNTVLPPKLPLPPIECAPDYLIELGAYYLPPEERWDEDEPIFLASASHEAALQKFHLGERSC